MPAKNLLRVDEEGVYSHIYNRGIEQRIIFKDEEDYKVFQSFLKDYLTPPKDPEHIKKEFKVNGRTFRGTPHQPKNYFNKVELVAYSLMPDHFHLLAHQLTRGSLESFIRSLCTRYSMYFNKKYKRTGALFEGPYKSIHIKHGIRLAHLTRYFHLADSTSSYPEYLGARETSWIKPKVVLSFFVKGIAGYKDFVEKYKPDQKDQELIDSIALDNEAQHLKGRVPASSNEKQAEPVEKSRLRIPLFLATSVAMFILLFALGIRNINVSIIRSAQSLPSREVLSETESGSATKETASADKEVKPTQETKSKEVKEPKIILTVRMGDASSSANIRQQPATDSAKLGKAINGDTFEFISQVSDWYELKLPDGQIGFISAEFIVKEEAAINE